MDAGVDDEPDRAPHLIVERAEVRVRILVEAHVVAERLRVESPAFTEGVVPAVPPEVGKIRLLLGQRDLQMMPGYGLVEHQGFHLPLGASVHGREIRIEITRPARGQRSTLVGAGGPGRGRGLGHRDHSLWQAREAAENYDLSLDDALGDLSIAGQELFRPGVEKPGIASHEREERREVTVEAGRAFDPL